MAHGKPFGGRTAVDVALDSEDAVDALYGLDRKWRDDDTLARLSLELGRDVGKFEEVSPRMGPAGSVGDRPLGPTGVIERVVAGVIVGLGMEDTVPDAKTLWHNPRGLGQGGRG